MTIGSNVHIFILLLLIAFLPVGIAYAQNVSSAVSNGQASNITVETPFKRVEIGQGIVNRGLGLGIAHIAQGVHLSRHASTTHVFVEVGVHKAIFKLTDNENSEGRWFKVSTGLLNRMGISNLNRVVVKLNGERVDFNVENDFVKVWIPHFSTNTIVIEELTGTYRLIYKKVTPGAVIDLSLPGEILSSTVEVRENVTEPTFDNSGGGEWSEISVFNLCSSVGEYGQYKIVINGDTWELYNVAGGLEASETNDNFWSLVQSDGDDIRVFNQSYSQLYFWIEEWDYTSQTATIKVNLTAGSSELNIAYGNPSAIESSYNNASYVYDYYSHFDTLPAGTLATYNSPNSADAYIDSSRLVVKNYESSGATGSGIGYIIPLNLPSADYRIEGHGFTSTHGSVGASLLGLKYEGDKVFNIKRWQYWVSGSTSATKVFGGTTIGEIYVGDDFTYDVIGHEIVAFCLLSSSAAGTTYTYLDELKIYKLADPADVSSFESRSIGSIVNASLKVNGNLVFSGDVAKGSSTGKLSVLLTGNDTIYYDADFGEADIIIEANYTHNVTVVVTEDETYITYDFNYEPSADVLNAVFNGTLDRNWNVTVESVTLDSSSRPYSIIPRPNIKASPRIQVDLGNLTAGVNYTGRISVEKNFLQYIFTGDSFTNVDLTYAEAYLDHPNAAVISFPSVVGSVEAGYDYITLNGVKVKAFKKNEATVKIVDLNTTTDEYEFLLSSTVHDDEVTLNISTDRPYSTFSVYRDGSFYETVMTDENGWINYTYSGGFSDVDLEFKLFTGEYTKRPTRIIISDKWLEIDGIRTRQFCCGALITDSDIFIGGMQFHSIQHFIRGKADAIARVFEYSDEIDGMVSWLESVESIDPNLARTVVFSDELSAEKRNILVNRLGW